MGLDKSARKFIKTKTESANWFIDAINQRRQTMLEIMNVIIKKQKVMFKEEKQELAPMILKDIATELDIDISTVSRATNGKYVQLPWGIFEIKDFFPSKFFSIYFIISSDSHIGVLLGCTRHVGTQARGFNFTYQG